MQKWILYAAAPTKKKEAMQGGDPPKVVTVFGRAGDVWSVAGVSCEREKKRLQRREKGWQEKRESRGGSLVVVLTACGGAGGRGRNGDSVGCLWLRKKEKDAKEENLQRGEERPCGGCAYRR